MERRLHEGPVRPEAFDVGPFRVLPITKLTDDGQRPFVEITQTSRRPDGSQKTQSFIVAFDRLCEIADRVGQVLTPGKQDPDRRKQQPAEERWWPVVRP